MKVRLKFILEDKPRLQSFLVGLSIAINGLLIREPDLMVSSMAALMHDEFGYIPRKYPIHKLVWRGVLIWWGEAHCRQCLEDEQNYIFEPKDSKLAALYKEAGGAK